MPKTDETFGERFRKITWLQWGLICLMGAGFSQTIGLLQPAANRAEAAGRGAAGLLFVVIGLVLIVLHFVLPKGGKSKARAKAVSPPSSRQAVRSADPPGLPPRRPGAKRP